VPSLAGMAGLAAGLGPSGIQLRMPEIRLQ
jgi:hypothetical protein